MNKSVWIFLLIFIFLGLSGTTIPQDKPSKQFVYLLTLEGMIDTNMARSLVKKFEQVSAQTGKVVILEIDTPGGELEQANKICREIDRISQGMVPVYAYVKRHAWSAGALIALACDKIYMTEQASIGSAEVKLFSPLFGMKNAGEKLLSAVRADFRAYAEKHDYPKALAEAMVDPSIEVREIHYRGERFFKTNEELLQMRNQMDADQIIDKGVVVPAGKLANFTANEAKKYGFCKEIYATRESMLKETGLESSELKTLKDRKEDAIVNFLTSDTVRVLLIAIGILGILIELWTPGFGIPGITGLTCLALFFVGGYLAETAAIWEILIFLLGLVLLGIEIFVIPGFGVVGIAGILCCLIGLLLSFQTFVLPNNEEEVNIFMRNVFKLKIGRASCRERV